MVSRLENAVINLLAEYDLIAQVRSDAPGVYIEDKKIASLGLRVKRGYCYHGISLNINMDLLPFSYINPCGYQGMKMVNLNRFISTITMDEVKRQFASALHFQMQYIGNK